MYAGFISPAQVHCTWLVAGRYLVRGTVHYLYHFNSTTCCTSYNVTKTKYNLKKKTKKKKTKEIKQTKYTVTLSSRSNYFDILAVLYVHTYNN